VVFTSEKLGRPSMLIIVMNAASSMRTLTKAPVSTAQHDSKTMKLVRCFWRRRSASRPFYRARGPEVAGRLRCKLDLRIRLHSRLIAPPTVSQCGLRFGDHGAT
jgi:hypothetical protein